MHSAWGMCPHYDILFSKPANQEQLQIARRLRETDSVLVQGPPGTGKTHTVANLIGHFLEEGKTVLVTAHTSKALRVLRGQIDEKLQPLCLSVLEGDAESREQLPLAVRQILGRVASSNAGALRTQAKDLRGRHSRLLRREGDLKERLRAARYSEIEELVIGGEGIRPTDAAKQVSDGEDEHVWLPAPIEHGVLCFSVGLRDPRALRPQNGIVAAADERELMSAQPSLANLLAPTVFRKLAGERDDALGNAGKHKAEFWDDHAESDVSADRLGKLLHELEGVKSMLADEEQWLGEVLFAGWMSGGHRRMWDDLVGTANALVKDTADTMSMIAERDARLPPGESTEDVESILARIVQHLQGGGGLGIATRFTKPRWRKVIADCRTYGREPKDLEDFATLLDAAGIRRKGTRFVAYWNRVMEGFNGPLISDHDIPPELVANSWVPGIRKRLEWREQLWEPFRAGLVDVGLKWDALLDCLPSGGGPHGDLDRVREAVQTALPELIEARWAVARRSELEARAEGHRSYLLRFPESKAARALERALAEWNPEAYEGAHFELARIEGLRSPFDRRQALLNKLAEVAPEWASAIARRKAPHHDGDEPVSDPARAWRWRQLNQELDRRAEESINGLLEKMGDRQREVRRLAGEIIDRGAWAAQCEPHRSSRSSRRSSASSRPLTRWARDSAGRCLH